MFNADASEGSVPGICLASPSDVLEIWLRNASKTGTMARMPNLAAHRLSPLFRCDGFNQVPVDIRETSAWGVLNVMTFHQTS